MVLYQHDQMELTSDRCTSCYAFNDIIGDRLFLFDFYLIFNSV